MGLWDDGTVGGPVIVPGTAPPGGYSSTGTGTAGSSTIVRVPGYRRVGHISHLSWNDAGSGLEHSRCVPLITAQGGKTGRRKAPLGSRPRARSCRHHLHLRPLRAAHCSARPPPDRWPAPPRCTRAPRRSNAAQTARSSRRPSPSPAPRSATRQCRPGLCSSATRQRRAAQRD